MVRLAKYIASSGLYSRKEAENLILEGKVKVNGVIYKNFVIEIPSIVEVNNNKIEPSEIIKIYKFHKIAGTVTTSYDPENRVTIYDTIKKHYSFSYNFKTVGRLDYNTEGLLLLTNQGKIARALELPKNNFERIYEVKIWGHSDLHILQSNLKQGIYIDAIWYKPITLNIIESKNNKHTIHLTLKEGKNREIRNIMAFFNFRIKSLKRLKFGPISLGKLPPGALVEISQREYKEIYNALSNIVF